MYAASESLKVRIVVGLKTITINIYEFIKCHLYLCIHYNLQELGSSILGLAGLALQFSTLQYTQLIPGK